MQIDLEALLESTVGFVNKRITDATPAERLMVFGAIGAGLMAAVSGMGECRRKTPFSTLHPVIDNDGTFMWCCNHDPEHCTSG